MTHSLLRSSAFSLLALLVGCRASSNAITVAQMPPPDPRPAAYLIQPTDQLEIRFLYTPEFNVTLPVRPDGSISLPLAQNLRAAGKSAEDVANDLVQAYGRIYRDPEIAVVVRTFSEQQIFVGGRVFKPGIFPLNGPMNVMQAIMQAGTFEPQAWYGQVLVIRKQRDGMGLVIVVNMNKVINGTDMSQNLMLQPFDVIYVPNSPIAVVNKYVDLYVRQNIPVQFGIRFPF